MAARRRVASKLYIVLVAAPAVLLLHGASGNLNDPVTALALARDHPRHVSALVLLAPVSHPWPGGVSWYGTLGSMPVIERVFTS